MKNEKLMSESVKLTGTVEVRNGDTHFVAKNKFVNRGLIHLINLMSANGASDSTGGSYACVLGTDTATPTTGTETVLVAPDATAYDSKSGANSSPGAGTYRMVMTFTWNAGTIAAITVGEIGIKVGMAASFALQAFAHATAMATAGLFSRLSNADGEFSTFVVNVAAPLVVTWTFEAVFA